jgi:hypothetical protein
MAATTFPTRARCNGMPSGPRGRAELQYEHVLRTSALGEERASSPYERLQRPEAQRRFAIA